MSRRHAPTRRWHVGDRCLTPVEIRMAYPPPVTRTYWEQGVVVAVRGDRIVVRRYSWEHVHPWWELRVPPRHRGNCSYRGTWQGRGSRVAA
jgi:hypothetical protein